MPDGRVIDPGPDMVTERVTSAMPGVTAWMIVVPGATPTIGTFTVACELPSGNKPTLGCTCATPGLSEVRLTVSPPAGAAEESDKLTLWLTPCGIVMLEGEKLSVKVKGPVPT